MPTDNHNHPAAGVEDFLAAGELFVSDLAGFTVDEPSVSVAAAAIEEQRAVLRDLDRFQYAANLPPGCTPASTPRRCDGGGGLRSSTWRPPALRDRGAYGQQCRSGSAPRSPRPQPFSWWVSVPTRWVKIAKGGQTNSSSDATTAVREADSQQLTDAASDSDATGQAEIAPVTSGDPENDFGRSAEASASPPESGRPDGTDRSLSASSDSGPVTDRSNGSGPLRPKANWLRCAGDPRPIDERLRTPNS